MGLGSKAAHRPKGRNTLKAVADEAGGGGTCGTIAEAPVPRMHVTERLLTSACAALNLHRLSIHAASCQHLSLIHISEPTRPY